MQNLEVSFIVARVEAFPLSPMVGLEPNNSSALYYTARSVLSIANFTNSRRFTFDS